MRIQTANIAGGDLKTHRTIDAAAKRIASQDGPFGGYVIISAEGVDAEQVMDRVNEIIDEDLAKNY